MFLLSLRYRTWEEDWNNNWCGERQSLGSCISDSRINSPKTRFSCRQKQLSLNYVVSLLIYGPWMVLDVIILTVTYVCSTCVPPALCRYIFGVRRLSYFVVHCYNVEQGVFISLFTFDVQFLGNAIANTGRFRKMKRMLHQNPSIEEQFLGVQVCRHVWVFPYVNLRCGQGEKIIHSFVLIDFLVKYTYWHRFSDT